MGKHALSPKVRKALAIAAASILGAVLLSILVIAAVIEIQAGATAYIIGEGHWSRVVLTKKKKKALDCFHCYFLAQSRLLKAHSRRRIF
jgi:hypothetical protein